MEAIKIARKASSRMLRNPSFCSSIARSAMVTCSLVVWSLGCAAAPEDSWEPLIHEPSRSQLFRAEVTARSGLSIDEFGTAFPAGFHFPTNALTDENGTVRNNSVFGLDISHYEGFGFPFAELRKIRVSFVYVKATQGTRFADKTFGPNWLALGKLPAENAISRGAYHFLSSDPKQSGRDQADRFLAYITLHGGFRADDLPPAVDLEWDRACASCEDRWGSASDIINAATGFIARITQVTGRVPLLYTNKSFLSDHGIRSADQIRELTSTCKVWIFDLSSADRDLELPDENKNLRHVLWQFTWNGKLEAGYKGDLDVDVYQGTIDQFKHDLLN